MSITKKDTLAKKSPITTTTAAPPATTPYPKIDMDEVRAKLEARRAAKKQADHKKPEDEPVQVAAGPVDKITDVLINPFGLKILELTNLDRNHVALIPHVLTVDAMWDNCIEVAAYRNNIEQYRIDYGRDKPLDRTDIVKDFVLLIARCRRSLQGLTQKALEELALADLDSRGNEGGGNLGGSGFDEP